MNQKTPNEKGRNIKKQKESSKKKRTDKLKGRLKWPEV